VLGALSMEFHSNSQPQVVLNRVNELLCRKSLPFQFVTLFLFLLNPDGTGQFISAGHNPAYLFRSATGKFKSWHPTPMFGMFDFASYQPRTFRLDKETFWWSIPTGLRTRKTSGKKCSERKDCWRSSARRSVGKSRAAAEVPESHRGIHSGMPQTDDITFVVVEKC